MRLVSKILILMFCLCLWAPCGDILAVEESDSKSDPNSLVPDLFKEGYLFKGIEGSVKPVDEDARKWVFVTDEKIEGPRGELYAGDSLRLLPSSTLQRIIANQDKTDEIDVRLWARTANYAFPVKKNQRTYTGYDSRKPQRTQAARRENYLFPVYFLPLSSDEPAESNAEESTTKDNEKTDPGDDDSILPDEIRKALKPKKIVDLAKAKKTVDVEGDMMLINRTGVVRKQGKRYIFEVDALGRNVADLDFELLPCRALERMQRHMGDRPVKLRWKVAGIVTKFNGEYFLLPQRATRVYNNGNFSR
ncbi:hypothetical protein STSP2_01526 [Anaerohalosphaera lusitana]|uniref:Uncharacterized protein n=1 Tax=Anaerohalosphaera lusitana TaxID=1936003 RepID=A0A1U9NLJ5_9BACT|nr:hypothetical protein [Anaerohalosphaera lusitana]AQT68366.1 hypothetical protein STSP2_01526 [Anaerohalosphaera lusitana]